jgi:hypothetical protein
MIIKRGKMRRLLNNKKGAEMTIGTIIVIILALVVLVVLIVGFTQGWGSFGEWLKNIFWPATNLDAVISGCNNACATQSENGYCFQIRDVKFPKDKYPYENGKYNCKALDEMDVGLEPCGTYSSCAPVQPICKPKVNCASLASDKSKCESEGCEYIDPVAATPSAGASPAKCNAPDTWKCSEQSKETCKGFPVGESLKPCKWE